MRIKSAPIGNDSDRKPKHAAWLYGAFALGLSVALVSISPPALAFPEIIVYRADETDAYPPTYIAEQQAAGDIRPWAAESIFYRAPAQDPAGTLRGRRSVLGEHAGFDRYADSSGRQRLSEFAKFFSPGIETSFAGSTNSGRVVNPDRPGRRIGPTGTGAEALLIESGFSDFILDIVEANIEPGGGIALTLKELGRFAMIFSRDSDSIRSIGSSDMGPKETSRRSAEQELLSGVVSGYDPQNLSRSALARKNHGSMNSSGTFLEKLMRLAAQTLTHPGFIVFAVFGIGLIILSKLRRETG